MLNGSFQGKQSGVPIVPVMMQGDGYKPGGWMALLTAGQLWTPLYDPASFDTNIEMLLRQIRQVMPASGAAAGGGGGGAPPPAAAGTAGSAGVSAADGELFTVAEMRGELERLKAELTEASSHGGKLARPAGEKRQQLDPTGPCGLPAMVPELPHGLCVSSEMRQLATALLSPTTGLRVGFHGMG